jgi:hypothetical protein
MAQAICSSRLELSKQECAEMNLEFVDAVTPDPASDVGLKKSQEFILEDVQKMIKRYGKDTAFFCTYCPLNIALIQAVLETGAIYPQPCHPSPNHGFSMALHLFNSEESMSKEELQITIDQIEQIISEKKMLNRFSTWPISADLLFTDTAAEYAIKWINGEVPKEGVDADVLKQLMKEYAGVDVYLTPFVDDGTHDHYERESEPTGQTYNNFLLMRMDYVTFEELGAR